MDREKFVAYSVAIMCLGLWLSDNFTQAKAEDNRVNNAKVAQACIPPQGERRILEWVVDENGNQTLIVTAQKFIGTRKGAVQYAILSSEEIQP